MKRMMLGVALLMLSACGGASPPPAFKAGGKAGATEQQYSAFVASCSADKNSAAKCGCIAQRFADESTQEGLFWAQTVLTGGDDQSILTAMPNDERPKAQALMKDAQSKC